MTEPLFSVASDVFDAFPDYIVGWVVARIASNAEQHPGIDSLLRAAEERARISFEGKDLKEQDAIAVWRQAFSSLGWSASKFPASIEALAKRAARGATLPNINPAVDLGNATALTYLVPTGCHDLAQSPGLTVRFSTEGDTFTPMGDARPEAPAPGEIVYASGNCVRTRRWVWRQSRDALVGEQSTELLFPVDGFASVTAARVDAATHFLAGMLQEHLGADVRSGLVSQSAPEVLARY